jgi:prephenate dehydrogenase
LDLVESFLPISAQNWQAVADILLENYRQEAQTAESLRRKFQEIARGTGPTGDPNCPDYVIKAN